MKKFVNEVKSSLIIYIIFLIAFGIVLLIHPQTTMQVICYCFGGGLMLCGAIRAVRYFFENGDAFTYNSDLSSGLIMAVIGLFILIKWQVIVSVVPIIFALIICADGISELQNALDMRKFRYTYWYVSFIISLIAIAFGVIVICNPFASVEMLMRFIGICLIYNGVTRLMVVHRVDKVRKNLLEDREEYEEYGED